MSHVYFEVSACKQEVFEIHILRCLNLRTHINVRNDFYCTKLIKHYKTEIVTSFVQEKNPRIRPWVLYYQTVF